MAYIKPESVNSPRKSISNLKVLHNQGHWSVAEMEWNGKPALGLRWNGSDKEEGMGMPNSFGKPTWMILPSELTEAIKAALPQKTDLEQGYEAMASDEIREAEALDFCNSLIGDGDNHAAR